MNFTCEVCGKVSDTFESLKEHHRPMTEDRMYKNHGGFCCAVGHQKVLRYQRYLKNISGVMRAHIHKGKQGENGPVVADLFGNPSMSGPPTGRATYLWNVIRIEADRTARW